MSEAFVKVSKKLPQTDHNALKRIAYIALLTTTVALSGCLRNADAESTAQSRTSAAPEFVGLDGWLNSAPLTMTELRGKVVLIEFWTHGCINCIHVLPHTNDWYQTYKNQGLVVVGIHTPEFAAERPKEKVQAAMQRFGIQYPVALDGTNKTWDAYGNRYWPALYLIDRDGVIVLRHYGEGDYAQTEAAIRAALHVQ